MLRLFIYDNEVELTSDVIFALTKQFEDITDPTTIINDWSKTVEIPFTAKNNQLFGRIFSPDRIPVVSPMSTGIYFNPMMKMDFRLVQSDNVVMTGYAKMDSITQSGGKGTYNLSLFGQLGKVFQEMKKITFDRKTDEPEYLIDGTQYFEVDLNKELVVDCWNKSTFVENITGATAADIIGFAPNNSFDNDIDYEIYQNTANSTQEFVEVLESIGFQEKTGIDPSTVIPDGLKPREIGEYKSYLQIPYIFFNKLFQIFQKKSEEITGYKFDLDSSWFTNTNPYWNKLVMMASRPFDKVQDAPTYTNQYNYNFNTTIWWNDDWTTERGATLMSSHSEEQYPLFSGGTYTVDNSTSVILPSFTFRLRVPALYISGTRKDIKWKDGAVLRCNVEVIDSDSNDVLKQFSYYFENENGSHPGFGKVPVVSEVINGYYNGWNLQIDPISLTYGIEDVEHIKIRFAFVWSENPLYYDAGTTYQPPGTNYTTMETLSQAYTTKVKFDRLKGLTINDFWNNDYNLFTEILNYCKMFRILIMADSIDKKIKFIPATKYFQSYTVSDWSDKLDKNNDYSIKPISFENKYIMFNYEDSDLYLQDDYVEKYGYNYGEKRINTNYQFNTNTKNLFDDINTSINISPNVLSWTSLYDKKSITYTRSGEVYVLCYDDTNKYVRQFGNYFFWIGRQEFSTDADLRGVGVSDDTEFQEANEVRCYTQAQGAISVTHYPLLTIDYNNDLCLFNTPYEKYVINRDYTGSHGIYDKYWENYLNERYHSHNKIVTCYLYITPNDYHKFEFNHFITIHNQLYMINKIYDYDANSTESTKVDLITIQNVRGYTTN